MKAELSGRPTVAGQNVELKVRIELDGKWEDFLVTMWAPGLYRYVPPRADVRWAIEQILAVHQAELREMLGQIWSTAHAVPPPRRIR